jgi:hypothetical protein
MEKQPGAAAAAIATQMTVEVSEVVVVEQTAPPTKSQASVAEPAPVPATAFAAAPAAASAAASPTTTAAAAVAAPVLQHAHVAPELVRALNECLRAPRLMTAEEYRACYPAYDAHNDDYMAYRERWMQAEREQREAAAGLPGAPPRVASRSLMCTPSREIEQQQQQRQGSSFNGNDTPLGINCRSPLSPYRTLSPSLAGSFGYRGDSGSVNSSTISSLSPAMRNVTLAERTSGAQQSSNERAAAAAAAAASSSASLYLPAPVFIEEMPAEFLHKNSVMALMLESSRPSSSLRATPLDGFLVREEHASKYCCSPQHSTHSLSLNAASTASGGTYDSGDSASEGVTPLPSPFTRRNALAAADGLQDVLAATTTHSSHSHTTTTVASPVESPLFKSFRPKQFSSNLSQTTTTMTATNNAPAEQAAAFVPVLPATHVSSNSNSGGFTFVPPASVIASSVAPPLTPEHCSSSPQRMAIGSRSTLAPLVSSSKPSNMLSSTSSGGGRRMMGHTASSRARASNPASANNTPPGDLYRRSLSDGINTPPRCGSAQQLLGPLRPNRATEPFPAAHQRQSSLSSTASVHPLMEPSDVLTLSLPGTPAAEDDSGSVSRVTPSASVLRSQAHIASITRGWQECVEEGTSSGSSASVVVLPSISPQQSHRSLQPQQSTPMDPRYNAASASVSRKLTIPAASRLRAVKQGLFPLSTSSTDGSSSHAASPRGDNNNSSSCNFNNAFVGGGGMNQLSSPSSALPPPSPKPSSGQMAKRRLQLHRLSASYSELPSPARAESPILMNSESPQQLQRRRFLQQLAANSTGM